LGGRFHLTVSIARFHGGKDLAVKSVPWLFWRKAKLWSLRQAGFFKPLPKERNLANFPLRNAAKKNTFEPVKGEKPIQLNTKARVIGVKYPVKNDFHKTKLTCRQVVSNRYYMEGAGERYRSSARLFCIRR
jgi:hypothetical protein